MRKKKKWLILAAILGVLFIPVIAILTNPDLLHQRPLNSFTFHLVDWAYPIETVPRSKHVFALQEPTGKFDLEYSIDGRKKNFRDFVDGTFTTSILLLRENQILAEEYFYLTGRSTRFLGHSLSKSVTSTLVGIALEKGFLRSLDQTVDTFPGPFKDTGFAKATIRDLLNMTSGMEATEDWQNPESTVVKFADAVLSFDGSVFDVVINQRKVAEPGQIFNYSTTDTQVLGWLLEKATGQSIAKFNASHLWDSIGTEADAFYYLTFGEPRTAIPGGSFNATTRDYARFGLMALYEGRLGDHQVVSKGWFDLSPDSENRKVGNLGKGYPPDMGYHKSWWVLDNQGRRFCAWGIYGQFICADRDSRVVMVKTSAFPAADSPTHEKEVLAFFAAFAEKYID